jgi:hypothetical protein
VVPFIFEKFDAAMTRLGCEATAKEDAHAVRVSGKAGRAVGARAGAEPFIRAPRGVDHLGAEGEPGRSRLDVIII